MKIVYHGSENGNLKTINANISTHQKNCIYATPSKVVAMLFISQGNRDLDTMIGTIDGELMLLERRPGILDSLYNKDGYLYELDGSSFKHYDYLWSKELISFEESLVPLKVIYYENILKELNKEEKKGNIKIYRYPDRPKNIPLDNSDLIDKYIEFERQGIKGAINNLLDVYPEFEEIVIEKTKDTDLFKKHIKNT